MQIFDLGCSATVFMDNESHAPKKLSDCDGLMSIEDYAGGADALSANLIDSIDIVSTYTLHVALYALQNPTPENIRRALYKIGTSGDCEEHIDSDTLMPLSVPEPSEWGSYLPPAKS